MRRRHFLISGALSSALSPLTRAGEAPVSPALKRAKVVVVGGGFGGATAAKYLRLASNYSLDVTLVEPSETFVSCLLSNHVLGGSLNVADITRSFEGLAQHHGVRWVRDCAMRVDPQKREVLLGRGVSLTYDRLILSPGVDFIWDSLPGMQSQSAQHQILHAWKAGPQTLQLRQQLQAMPDGGVFAIAIPLAPYRCPPAPYERACQVAHYFRKVKPRSKVLILDANEDITSLGALFRNAWAQRYPNLIEYRPNHALEDVQAATRTLKFEFDDEVSADVLNVLPAMRAGDIAVQSGLATANGRWCEVDFLSHESIAQRNVHVLGDAVQVAPQMPKSGHMAHQHGKVCAAAVVALLEGREPNDQPLYNNVCYSFVDDRSAMHVSSLHRYDHAARTMLPVHGSGELSSQASEAEGRLGEAWAQNIWAEIFS